MTYEVKLLVENEIVIRTGFDNYYQAEDYVENLKDTNIERFVISDNFEEVLSEGTLPYFNIPSKEEILSDMFPDEYF